MSRKLYIFLIIILVGLQSCNSPSPNNSENKIIVFHAGSLSVPFKSMIEEYNKENPEVEIFVESSGSLAAARKVTDLNKECDILAVSDYLVIENLIIPEYASWNYVFAANEMVIAYKESSKRSESITSENWYEIFKHSDVIVGRSEPNVDPCGYRSVFLFKLAEKYYEKDNLASKLITKSETVIRPKEVDLIALLETGNIDYLMIYKSVALQHNLEFIELPDEINLSNPEFESLYNQVSTEVDGSTPDEKVSISGSAILYSFCIPTKASNFANAVSFLSFIANPEKGGKILQDEGMSVVNFCDTKYHLELPEELKSKLN